jgi:UDP-glucose 4-epimerase
MAKNILIIGGTGFVGKNIFDSNNYIYDSDINYYFLSSKSFLPFDLPNLFLLNFNYFDENHLNYIFENYTFDEIWHFLSSSVPSTSQNLLEFSIQKDLIYLIKILDLMKANKVNKIVYLSSGGTVYSGYSDISCQEDLITTPSSPYGILKTTMEHFIKYYHKNFGLNYCILRISNLFGPHHYNEHNGIINIAIRKFIKGDSLTVFGDGSIAKDFLFVSDFSKIYWDIIRNKKTNNNVINVGSGYIYSVNDIMLILKRKLPQFVVRYINGNKIENNFSELSLIKLKGILPLKITSFELAVDKTIKWEFDNFKQNLY